MKAKLKDLDTKTLQLKSNIDSEGAENDSLNKKNQKIRIGT